ncbi:MAG: hypothetical protein B6D59_05445 [Campylobacteraceae bacterium 4484_4]|nr:MAG: hypothetical protein B6D59_05445 [Campylobacteraceae bacterium 4484_4]
MKYITIFLLLLTTLLAKDLKPVKEIQMHGNVMDIVIKDDILYAGTTAGMLEMYDIKKEQFIGGITLKKIHDFMGDLMQPKVYAVDVMDNRKLLLAEGENGVRELYIHENNTTTKVLAKHELTMQKARFIDKDHVFIGLLSNEILLFDLKTKKILYLLQLSESKFSDFALSEDRTKAVISCESGINYLVTTKDGKLVKELKGANKDNVFKVDFKKNRVSTAGQDRVGAVYDVDTGSYKTFRSDFLIYATGLSPNAQLAAFAFSIDNDIAIFDLSTDTKRYTLKGQKSTLNTIVFYDEKTIFSGSDDRYIMKWQLP